jgi:hypothetical protein
MSHMTTDPVSLLCDLAEASSDEFQAAELDARYGSALRALADLGVIEAGAPLGIVTCRACDADHFATVEFDSVIRGYSYFCPEAGLLTVADSDLATLLFNPAWLVEWLIRVQSCTVK